MNLVEVKKRTKEHSKKLLVFEIMDDKYSRAFNARYMSFEEVARSFIVSDHFISIISCEHTILTGSRGCGKTTLLKMLHPKALNEWNNSEANRTKSEIPFIGIYIPADRQWKSQLDSFERKFDKNKDFVESIFRGVVNSNILIAICSTFSALIDINNIDESFEIDLSLKLIENWKIPTPIAPNLDDITIKLRKMVGDFNSIFHLKNEGQELPEICNKDFIDLVSLGIDCFESLVRKRKLVSIKYRNKWALCFDELEIAPKYLQNELVNLNLRSRSDQRIIFKLTSTPGLAELSEKKDVIRPSEKDDFSILKLWIYNSRSQRQWREFCNKYMTKSFEKRYNCKINLKSLFGEHNYIDGLKSVESFDFSKNKSKKQSEFDEGGTMWNVMYLLQKYDDSFKEYLIRKNIDPDNPIPKNSSQTDAIHRKIKPIVLYRYYFTEKSVRANKNIKLRSRNINAFNHGIDYIFDIADGNPRAFANLVNEFIDMVIFNSDKSIKKIDIQIQSRIIEAFSINYSYLRIRNYPKNEIKNNDLLLYEIIDKIGEYFFKRLVLDDFNADPIIFFYVEKKDKNLREFVDIALESGAILKIEEEINKKGVRNNIDVYRLSYSLYPKYKLPKVNYNPISLSSILNSQKTFIDYSQPNLFTNILE